MFISSHVRVLALALVATGFLHLPAVATDSLDGAWLARNVRWRAPRAQTAEDRTDPRRRPSETVLIDLRLEIRPDGDSLLARLSNVRDPEDTRWLRLLGGRRVGDSVFLAAAASEGRPNLAFEGAITSERLTGHLNVPPPADLRPGLLRPPASATGRQAIPELPTRDQRIPVQFWRAPE